MTTSTASTLKVQCVLQYKLKPERIIDLFSSAWKEVAALERDLIQSVKATVQVVANKYQHEDFFKKRSEIQKHMSYEVGKKFKERYYGEVSRNFRL